MHCWFSQWMSMSDMNFCDSFWILTRGLKRINFSAFYLSCSPGSLVVWTRWNPMAYPEWRLGGSTLLHLLDSLNCVFAQKYCPISAPVFMKSNNFYRKALKLYFNFTILLHFFFLGGAKSPRRGFALDHTKGQKSVRPPDSAPFTQFLIHPCESPPLWNTGYAYGETHPNNHPLKALGCGSTRHTGVMWGHPILDINRHVICAKYCHNFIIKRHQYRHNCCYDKPYFYVNMHQIQTPLGDLTALPRTPSSV